MLIVSYIFLLQLSELLSIIIPAIIFLILRYVFHIHIEQIRQAFYKHALFKVALTLLLCECSSFLLIYPLLQRTFSQLSTYPELISASILFLQLFPWIIKSKKGYDIVKDKKTETKDHAIYQ